MRVYETNDAGKVNAAREIIREHSPEQIEQILTWCDPSMALLIRVLITRHGVRRPEERL
jgi:hypothetical protein